MVVHQQDHQSLHPMTITPGLERQGPNLPLASRRTCTNSLSFNTHSPALSFFQPCVTPPNKAPVILSDPINLAYPSKRRTQGGDSQSPSLTSSSVPFQRIPERAPDETKPRWPWKLGQCARVVLKRNTSRCDAMQDAGRITFDFPGPDRLMHRTGME